MSFQMLEHREQLRIDTAGKRDELNYRDREPPTVVRKMPY
jgi:hypothetical protein